MWNARKDGVYAYDSKEAKENAAEIRSILTSKGWSLNAICAVLGNCFAEGGANPWQWEYALAKRPQSMADGYKTGYGYGLFGWTPAAKYFHAGKNFDGYAPSFSDRAGNVSDGKAQTLLMDHCITNSISWQHNGKTYSGVQWVTGSRGNAGSTSGYGQNWYRYYQLVGKHTMSAKDFKVSKKSAEELALTFLECFEGPYNPVGSYKHRQNVAKYYFDYFTKEDELDMTKDEVVKLINATVAAQTATIVAEITKNLGTEIDRRAKELLSGKNSQPSDWIVKSHELEQAKNLGITDGSRPQGYAKREEVAAMVLRAVMSVEKNGEEKDLPAEVAAAMADGSY